MRITIKKLEILFVIVYFLATSVCFVIFKSFDCLLGSVAGFLVSLGDWYLLKFMAKKWIRKGRYSMIDSAVRFTIVGISIYALLRLNINQIGMIEGISIVPASLILLALYLVITKRKIVV